MPDAQIDAKEWTAAIAHLDGIIELKRQSAKGDVVAQLTTIFGSFLGEAIVQTYDGTWEMTDMGIGVNVAGTIAFPFGKVHRQFENGAEDSITHFFKLVPSVVRDHADAGGVDHP